MDFQSIESHHFLTTNPYTFKLIFLAPQGIIIHYYNHFFYSQILLPTTPCHYFLKKDISFELPDLLLPIPPMFLLLCLLFSFLLSHCKKFISSPLDSAHLSLGYQLCFLSQNFYFLMCNHFGHDKGLYSQSCSFSSSHVQMWKLNHKEGWTPKNWCFWTVVLEKTLESAVDCRAIRLVNPEGNQLWIFIERTELKLTLQYFDHLMQRATSLEKTVMLERLRAGGEGGARWWDD